MVKKQDRIAERMAERMAEMQRVATESLTEHIAEMQCQTTKSLLGKMQEINQQLITAMNVASGQSIMAMKAVGLPLTGEQQEQLTWYEQQQTAQSDYQQTKTSLPEAQTQGGSKRGNTNDGTPSASPHRKWHQQDDKERGTDTQNPMPLFPLSPPLPPSWG